MSSYEDNFYNNGSKESERYKLKNNLSKYH